MRKIESITSLATPECQSAPSCSLTAEQCLHLAFPLLRHIAAHLLGQFAERQNLPPFSLVPSRNLLVDCKDPRSVIVIFCIHRVHADFFVALASAFELRLLFRMPSGAMIRASPIFLPLMEVSSNRPPTAMRFQVECGTIPNRSPVA
jgi:hypothetical protein